MMNDLRTLSGIWCRVPGRKADYSLFRRRFYRETPSRLRLLVSADSRYNLYLDGEFLGRGPVRGDLEHYRYELHELAVGAGEHVLSAEVLFWSDGVQMPWSEIHFSPAFLLLGECGEENLSTGGQWVCRSDPFRRTLSWKEAWDRETPTPIPPMEKYLGGNECVNWKELFFDDSTWETPEIVGFPCFSALCKTDPPSRWKLQESTIPPMESIPIRIASILERNPAGTVRLTSEGNLKGEIPAGTHTLLLDLGRYYTHLPRFRATGGSGSCRMAYAEALFVAGRKSGDRGPVSEGEIGRNGYGDRICFFGGKSEFQPFWYRSGRYVELQFELTEGVEIELYRKI